MNGVNIGAGTLTNVTASGPLASSGGATPNISIPLATNSQDGYLSSTDRTAFSAKLSDFSTLLSSDITSKLGYTPVNPATAVTSVAGRTGVVTLSSSDITGLAFGTAAGTYAQGNDSRFTDTRTPTDNTVTSAKIVDGTITSADISSAAVTFDKLNQSSASTGQVIKWSGSNWVASGDSTGLPASGGSAALPGYAFGGDPDTGVFSATGNTIGFSTNGTEKMKILSNGNVGIGLSSPSDRFSVYQANGSVGASIISDNTASNTARYPYLSILNYLGSPANGAGGSPAISLINMRGNSSTSVAMQSGESLGSKQNQRCRNRLVT